MTTAFGSFAGADLGEPQQQRQQVDQQQQLLLQQQQQLPQGHYSNSNSLAKQRNKQRQNSEKQPRQQHGSPLPQPQPKPARDIRKLYDEALRQDREMNADASSDANQAQTSDRFDESKAVQILAIQSEIDALKKLGPDVEKVRSRKRKRSIACSDEVLLATLKRLQPTQDEWSQLAKHLRNIRGGVNRLSDFHRKMELIKSQRFAESSPSSRLQACNSNSGMELVAVASATDASNVQIVRKGYGNNHWNVELVLALLLNAQLLNMLYLEFVELSLLLEQAIMEVLKIPASLVKVFISLLRGNSTEFQLRLANWSKLGYKQLVFGLDVDGLRNVVSRIAVAFLIKLEMKMTSAKINEMGQRILFEITAAHESRQVIVVNSLFATSDLFRKLMGLAPSNQCARESQTFPTSQATLDVLCSKVTNLHYFNGLCPSCEQIRYITGLFRNTADAENVRVALFYKHFSEFFHYQKYAFRHLPVALLPQLPDPDIQQSLVPVSLQKQIAVIQTANNHFFTMLYAGIQPAAAMSFEQRHRDGLYHSIEFSETKPDELHRVTVVMTTTAAFDWLKRICVAKEKELAKNNEMMWNPASENSNGGMVDRNVAEHQHSAIVAYSGSFRGLVALANEGYTAGVFNVNTWFYSLSITSGDQRGDSVFIADNKLLSRLEFVERLILVLTDGSAVHYFLEDPEIQDWSYSVLERMIRFLGIRTRFQLTLEVQPLPDATANATRNSERILFDGESLHNRVVGNLRVRNVGLITRKCIEQLFSFGQYEFGDAFFNGSALTTLNLSYCDLSVGDPISLELSLQHVLRTKIWPSVEMNLDDTKLKDPQTVEVLCDILCHQADSRFLVLSLNNNPGLGSILFERLFGSCEQPGALHFPYLRLLSVFGCLTTAQLQQINGDAETRATRNTGRTVKIERYKARFFDNAGIPTHNHANDAVLTGENDLKIILEELEDVDACDSL